MIDVRRGADRYEGGAPATGITTRHAFSFGQFYDPDNIRFGPVLACNEETLAPGAGFDEHPHSHTEIVTWVVEGELTHKDSTTGYTGLVRPGDVQRLGSGSGTRHVERNDGPEPLRFVQMWLAPLVAGGEPSYELVPGIAEGTPYEVPAAGAVLHVRRPGAGERVPVPAAKRVYLHVVRGDLRLDGEELGPGDSARITGEEQLEIVAGSPGELLIWELP
ncbi:pirin family protein [Streptomyces sp. ISL-87]|uniref:pirin family protein n=1 Tax=unclassified Streptomyces TaxID=2593676 RepID=UPI001BEB65EF|nr:MULTISPECIES: pirin family protein [unclassified Streptomyces]MBT2458242.1 pirin family protein [Streptomyces sp. ISL-86]MBT2610068.1 pirin family protein [Streptomyces sp. ISL-87]